MVTKTTISPSTSCSRIVGGEGSGKSGHGKYVRAGVDPRRPDLVGLPKDLKDISIGAENTRVLAYDNLSWIDSEHSNALCRVSTGDGSEVRALYSPRDQTVFRGSNPLLITSVTEVITEPDLLSRCLSMWLPVRTSRKTKRVLAAEFRKLHPRLFGALCYAVARALRDLDKAVVPDFVRMQDVAQWALAAASAAGISRDEVLAAFAKSVEDADASVGEDPIILALAGVVAPGTKWEGRTTDLLGLLTAEAEARAPETGRATKRLPDHWPAKPRGLTSSLRRLEPTLKRLGYSIHFPAGSDGGEDGKQRILRIERTATPGADGAAKPGCGLGVEEHGALDDLDAILDAQWNATTANDTERGSGAPEKGSVGPDANGQDGLDGADLDRRNQSSESSQPELAVSDDPTVPTVAHASPSPSPADTAPTAPSPSIPPSLSSLFFQQKEIESSEPSDRRKWRKTSQIVSDDRLRQSEIPSRDDRRKPTQAHRPPPVQWCRRHRQQHRTQKPQGQPHLPASPAPASSASRAHPSVLGP